MPRRKKKKSPVPAILGVIACMFVAGRVINNLAAVGRAILILFVVAAGIAIIVLVILPSRRRNALLASIDSITDAHIEALVRQQSILIRNDAYGKPILDKWLREVNHFVANHVRPALNPRQSRLLNKEQTAVVQRITQRVGIAAQQHPPFATAQAITSPAAFEAFCAESLRTCGWGVSLTPMCRDQGVDIVAEKSNRRVALQCKLYSNPVGNKAVQEISAGRAHQLAHYGVVVTNNTYTVSAQELAASTGVRLLHYTDLPQLESILFGPGVV